MSQIEHLTANLAGRVSRRKLGGRDYLVAPLTMIVPGVLNGSQGPLYYPAEEVNKSPADWNHVPIVLYHPTVNGVSGSARDADVLDRQGLGIVLHSRVDDKGRLVAEGWFDVEAVRRVDPQLLENLEQGKAVELSTGLVLEQEPAEGAYNGKQYKAIARNYKPDHLAILPDQVGACSVRDGCGVLVNEGQQSWFNQLVSNVRNIFMADDKKKPLVDYLIANCDCWSEDDREVLTNMGEDKLKTHADHLKKSLEAAAVANAARAGFEGEDVKVVFNDDKQTFEVQKKEKEKPPVENKQDPPKPKTADEWLKEAPPEIRATVQNAMQAERRQKDELVESITANERNVFTKEQLAAKDLLELQAIAALLPKKEPVVNFAAAGSGRRAAGDKVMEEPLELPVMNWTNDETTQ